VATTVIESGAATIGSVQCADRQSHTKIIEEGKRRSTSDIESEHSVGSHRWTTVIRRDNSVIFAGVKLSEVQDFREFVSAISKYRSRTYDVSDHDTERKDEQ
jgi:hypothetical protein